MDVWQRAAALSKTTQEQQGIGRSSYGPAPDQIDTYEDLGVNFFMPGD